MNYRTEVPVPLSSVGQGESGIILRVAEEAPLAGRLCDLGFSEGVKISCVGRSPLGGMSAYDVLGCVVALRDRDASFVELVLT